MDLTKLLCQHQSPKQEMTLMHVVELFQEEPVHCIVCGHCKWHQHVARNQSEVDDLICLLRSKKVGPV